MNTKELRFGHHVSGLIFFKLKLEELGIKKKYTGYYYLVEMMNILINEDKKIKSFSREVYPMLAEKYSTNECTIERNIRSVIKKCWSNELMEKLNVYYPNEKRPPCRKFVFLIRDYMLKQIM